MTVYNSPQQFNKINETLKHFWTVVKVYDELQKYTSFIFLHLTLFIWLLNIQ